jgi:hypothetical protein
MLGQKAISAGGRKPDSFRRSTDLKNRLHLSAALRIAITKTGRDGQVVRLLR